MSGSISSFASKDVSSIISLNSYINESNLSTKVLFDFDPSKNVLSRPLSTCSGNSGFSITGTKDSTEGKPTIRTGLNQYLSNTLEPKRHYSKHSIDTPISRCSSRCSSKFDLGKSNHSNYITESYIENQIQQYPDLILSSCSTPIYPDCPTSPPMTLKEKIKLLNINRPYSNGNFKHPQKNIDKSDFFHNTHHTNSNDSINIVQDADDESIDNLLDSNNISNNCWDTMEKKSKMSKLEHELNLYHPSGGIDLQSDTSTLGDDESYLSTFRNLRDKENFGNEIDGDITNNNSNDRDENDNVQLFQSNEAIE